MPSRSKKSDAAIVVAVIGLIGTIVAALLNSSALANLFASGAEEAPPTPVFSEDFEDGAADTFDFDLGEWHLDAKGVDRWLDFRAVSPDENIYPVVYFGPPGFRDGAVEFLVNFVQPGDFYFLFRSQDKAMYRLYFMPDEIMLGYAGGDTNWRTIALEDSRLPHALQPDRWYAVRVETYGEKINAALDGAPIFSVADSRLAFGKLGFLFAPGSHVLLDDIKIWTDGGQP